MSTIPPSPAPPPFDLWFRQNRADLEDEYRDNNDEGFVYSEFEQWAKLEYDSEVYRFQMRNRR